MQKQLEAQDQDEETPTPKKAERRLLRKEVVLADNASWLFRVTPYIVFAATLAVMFLIPLLMVGSTCSVTAPAMSAWAV